MRMCISSLLYLLVGREELGVRSPDGSISSCGEASETMVIGTSKEDNGHTKKRKYSGIFRKRRGSYKLRLVYIDFSNHALLVYYFHKKYKYY